MCIAEHPEYKAAMKLLELEARKTSLLAKQAERETKEAERKAKNNADVAKRASKAAAASLRGGSLFTVPTLGSFLQSSQAMAQYVALAVYSNRRLLCLCRAMSNQTAAANPMGLNGFIDVARQFRQFNAMQVSCFVSIHRTRNVIDRCVGCVFRNRPVSLNTVVHRLIRPPTRNCFTVLILTKRTKSRI